MYEICQTHKAGYVISKFKLQQFIAITHVYSGNPHLVPAIPESPYHRISDKLPVDIRCFTAATFIYT